MAVYTHITEADAQQHLARFDIGALTRLTGIVDGVSNTNYKLETEKGAYILTLFEERVAAADLPFFVSFMTHLRARGIPCPDVVTTRDGHSVIPLCGRSALITTFLPGASSAPPSENDVAAMGALTAQMHLAAAGFSQTRVNSMGPAAWETLLTGCAGKTDLLPPLMEELSFLKEHLPTGLPSGVVHADLFPDNILFNKGALSGVIDFYFACTESFAYDLMLTFNAWCFDAGVFSPGKAARFMAAYKGVRPLSAPEEQALSLLGRAAALRIIATRLYDGLHPAPGALITPKNPQEYIQILAFHQAAEAS